MFDQLVILGLAYVQTMAFAMVSRARNRDSHIYHAICAVASNAIFFLTFQQLVVNEMSWTVGVPYIFGTVAGSLSGAQVSMWIERAIGAKS